MGLKFKCDGTLAEELRSDHVTIFQEHQDKNSFVFRSQKYSDKAHKKWVETYSCFVKLRLERREMVKFSRGYDIWFAIDVK